MNISTLAKTLGVSVNDLRKEGAKQGLRSYNGRNTRIPYKDAKIVTQILRPDLAEKLKNDDKIYLPKTLTVSELAEAIGKPPGMVVKSLIMSGVMATLNENIDYDTAELISDELGAKVYPDESAVAEMTGDATQFNQAIFSSSEGAKLVERPPVVTVMGHVDHGKTTLLDTIRKSNVVDGEAGAITQHISSYQIEHEGKKITFVDTPGHAAFTAMRARGTQLADFIILMVSATEGPKPQTVEVIERAKISKTPMIVAINKIDLPEADIEKAKADIAAFDIVPEEWGGDVPFIPISAKRGDGVDKILEQILLMAEVEELKAEVDGDSEAVVIESHKDSQLGTVATLLVTKNKIKVGDFLAYGENTGKIRTIKDSNGKGMQEAGVTMPVEVTGLGEVAETAELVKVFEDAKSAQNCANINKVKNANKKVFFSNTDFRDTDINVMLKADVQGSLEALKESIIKIPQTQIKINILGEGVGEVSDSDVDFAETSGAVILAFHTDIESARVSNRIQKGGTGLVKTDIIYEILEWLEEQILSNTKHEIRIEVLGKAKILAIFTSDKARTQIFGGEVIEGKLADNKELRVIREGEDIGRIQIEELQREKSKVKVVEINQQFGMSATSKPKVQKNDIIESIDEVVIK